MTVHNLEIIWRRPRSRNVAHFGGFPIKPIERGDTVISRLPSLLTDDSRFGLSG
jgi:hypothetical protein